MYYYAFILSTNSSKTHAIPGCFLQDVTYNEKIHAGHTVNRMLYALENHVHTVEPNSQTSSFQQKLNGMDFLFRLFVVNLIPALHAK